MLMVYRTSEPSAKKIALQLIFSKFQNKRLLIFIFLYFYLEFEEELLLFAYSEFIFSVDGSYHNFAAVKYHRSREIISLRYSYTCIVKSHLLLRSSTCAHCSKPGSAPNRGQPPIQHDVVALRYQCT